jgi:hypothetical protein
VLVGVKDISALRENPTGDLCHQARPVNSVEQCDDRENLHEQLPGISVNCAGCNRYALGREIQEPFSAVVASSSSMW